MCLHVAPDSNAAVRFGGFLIVNNIAYVGLVALERLAGLFE